jgi:hypothetical protein
MQLLIQTSSLRLMFRNPRTNRVYLTKQLNIFCKSGKKLQDIPNERRFIHTEIMAVAATFVWAVSESVSRELLGIKNTSCGR